MTDVLILATEDEKFYRVRPLTERAERFLQHNSPAEFWCSGVLFVPQRTIEKLAMVLHAEGLIVGGAA